MENWQIEQNLETLREFYKGSKSLKRVDGDEIVDGIDAIKLFTDGSFTIWNEYCDFIDTGEDLLSCYKSASKKDVLVSEILKMADEDIVVDIDKLHEAIKVNK